jgi:hypothetical protein
MGTFHRSISSSVEGFLGKSTEFSQLNALRLQIVGNEALMG